MNALDIEESSGKRRQSVLIARWQKSVQTELYLKTNHVGVMILIGTESTYCQNAVASKGMTVCENARERRGQCDAWLVDEIPNISSTSFSVVCKEERPV